MSISDQEKRGFASHSLKLNPLSSRPSSPISGSWLSSLTSSKTSRVTRTTAPCKDYKVARAVVEALQASVDQATEMARNLKGFADGLESAVVTYREM